MRWSDYFWGFHLAVRGFTDHAVGVLSEARHQAAIRRFDRDSRDIEPPLMQLASDPNPFEALPICECGSIGKTMRRFTMVSLRPIIESKCVAETPP